ncbi:MAG TPA: SH3 domain-containing protein [Pyrinomonadaceae bacterium]
MRLRFIFILALLVMSTVGANGQVKKLYPVDEAAKDPTFFVFRVRLLKAIQEKDTQFIYSILDDKIQNDFGGGVGIASFKTTWHAERPNSTLWSELLKVISLGGHFDEKDHSFSAPYLFGGFPEDVDEFEHGAIIEDGVRVRKEPSTRGEVLATLSFDIIEVPTWDPQKSTNDKREWLLVKLADGQKGYVAAEYVRSPIDYRAIFEKKNGKWMMTAFIAGD